MLRVHLATAGLVAVLVVVMAPVAAEAAPTATVTPSTGLVELQDVTVSGSGFGGSVDVYMCQGVHSESNRPDPNNCGGFIENTTASGTGSYTNSYEVHRFIYAPALGRTVDCAASASSCIMIVSDYFSTNTLLEVPLAFAPPPPPPTTRGSIDIEPGTAVDYQLVRVTGSGFRPGATVEVLQCPADPSDPTECGSGLAPATVDADTQGSFVTDVRATEYVFPPTGGVDCVTAVPDCVIAAAEVVDFPRTVVSAPLNMLGGPRPEVSVTPTSDLASGQEVTIHGTGFNGLTAVLFCQVTTSQGCGEEPGSMETSADGTFTVQYQVKRFLTESGGHDCVTEQCVIGVVGGPVRLTTPISFDPDAPAPRPDARLRNRATGAISFDNQYSNPGRVPLQRRTQRDPTWRGLDLRGAVAERWIGRQLQGDREPGPQPLDGPYLPRLLRHHRSRLLGRSCVAKRTRGRSAHDRR